MTLQQIENSMNLNWKNWITILSLLPIKLYKLLLEHLNIDIGSEMQRGKKAIMKWDNGCHQQSPYLIKTFDQTVTLDLLCKWKQSYIESDNRLNMYVCMYVFLKH